MVITGIEQSRYFLFNPIWVDIDDAPAKVRFNVEIEGEDNYFEMYSHNNKIRFDIGKLILGLIKNVSNKTTMIGAMDGAYEVKLKISSLTASLPPVVIYDSLKYFILGGVNKYDNNVVAPVDLSLTNYAWQGFPFWKSRMIGGVVNVQPDASEMKWIRPRVNCDNLFVAFRNNLGGFSYYLFESFTENSDAKNKGYYLTQRDLKVSGVDASKSYTVKSKVKRDFYETIEHLSNSFEIYLYIKSKWERVNGANNKVSFNNKEVAKEVEMDFDLITNFNKVW